MARYGTFKYSDEKYGIGDKTTLLWGFEVDWGGTGSFDGSNEASRVVGMSTRRGRRKYLRANRNGFEPLATGRAMIKLDNSDGRYNTFNTASPLYPDVDPGDGKLVRITVKDGSSGTKEDVFYGTLVDIRGAGYGDNPIVELIVEDGWGILRAAGARIPIEEDISIEDAIGLVLDDANWPATWGRDLQASGETIPFYWADGKAATEIHSLAESVLGMFSVGADGKAKFIPRTFVSSPAVTLLQSELQKDLTIPVPWEYQSNEVRVKIHPRVQQATGTLWEMTGIPISITAGETEEVFVDYVFDTIRVPAINVLTPVITTDYTANDTEDGSGADVTSDIAITSYDFGQTNRLRIKNNGAGTAYMQILKIRGDALADTDTGTIIKSIDATYKRIFELDLLWQQGYSKAISFAQVLVDFLSGNLPFPAVKIVARPDIQFAADIFDTSRLQLEKLGIDRSFRIGGIQHSSKGQNLQDIETVYYLESYIDPDQFWIWPITDFGTDTIFSF